MAIPESFIQDLLARVDVVEVIGRHVKLKKAGANWTGLCPFHNEKTASFSVSPSRQFYHCFGCGKSGNAIGFLMDFTGAGFVEVVQDLAQQQGLQVPDDRRDPAERARDAARRSEAEVLQGLLERAAQAYRGYLKNSPQAIAYLKRRGLTGRIARDFGLGWAPEGWRTLANVFGDYGDPHLVTAGLVVEREGEEGGEGKRYDRFRGRIMFPIRDVKGKLIGFGGRVVDSQGQPKYLNSAESPIFHKGHELYGLWEAHRAIRERGMVIVTEGYMDVVALVQSGFGNVVATLGTACTPDHVQKLFRFTDRIVFNFDGDAAGRAAAHKALRIALPFATDTRSVRFLFLPPEHDPDSFVREKGQAAFQAAVEEAMPLSQFLLEVAAEDCVMDTPEGRARFGAAAQELWALLPQGTLARQMLNEIATRIGISTTELEALWKTTRSAPLASSQLPSTSLTQGQVDHGKRRLATSRPQPRRARGGGPRAAGVGRAVRALQIVFTASELWLQLNGSDQHILCQLDAPYGALFTWLDAQMQELGPRPWPELRTALGEGDLAEIANGVMTQASTDIRPDVVELMSVLRQERPLYYEARMNAAIAAGDMEAYRALLPLFTEAKLAARGRHS